MPKSVATENIIKGVADWISVISGNFSNTEHKITVEGHDY